MPIQTQITHIHRLLLTIESNLIQVVCANVDGPKTANKTQVHAYIHTRTVIFYGKFKHYLNIRMLF